MYIYILYTEITYIVEMLRIVTEIRNDAICLSPEYHKSIVESTPPPPPPTTLAANTHKTRSNQYSQDAFLFFDNLTAASSTLTN